MTSVSTEIPVKSSFENISSELVPLIRGFFATPVITALGHLGIFELAQKQETFSALDLAPAANQKLVEDGLGYLSRIGILAEAGDKKWGMTALGRQVFQRLNSFLAPHSYRDYLRHYYEQVTGAPNVRGPEVDRLENIIGSGRTHERYFPMAVSYLRRKVEADWIADIGCGDGRFLEFVLKGVPSIKALGVDLSEISVKSTAENLSKKNPGRFIKTLACNAADISKWSEFLRSNVGGDKLVLSMWFLLHEISQKNPEHVIRFLNDVHRAFPSTPIIVGELVRQSAELLTQHRAQLIMPEYLLFHDISNQGVLSWPEYQRVFNSVPYTLGMQRLFDEIGPAGAKEPAAFVCCLLPK